MATEIFRKLMIEAYREQRDPDMFLAGMFEVRPRNISNSEKVAIDVVRREEHISPVVGISAGPTMNSLKQFTTKEWTPPSINEAQPFDALELTKRNAGQTEYDATDMGFQESFAERLLDGMNTLEGKIRRNREWQASQVLQTGTLTLVDEDGNDAYVIDFKPKSSHFPSAGTAWDAGGDPLADIGDLSDVIRDDSGMDANFLLMGDIAFNAFINNATVKSFLDIRRYEIGEIAPRATGKGGKYQGVIHIGAYQYEIWTYNGRGIIPGDSTNTRMIDRDACIVMASELRLDTVFAGVPMPTETDARFRDILPPRISVPTAIDLAPNIWTSLNGKTVMLEIESRPLVIPTAIDGFGNIDTGVTVP